MAESDQNVDILLELKSAVLNIDWEISDDTLNELGHEISRLQSEWAGQKVQLVYLQILGALCQYIGASREKSHPGTFLLLKEAFEGLESVVLHPEVDQAEKNKNVMAYAERYNILKKEIASGDFTPGPAKDSDEEKSTKDTLVEDDDDHSTDSPFDSMLNAMVQNPEETEGEEDTTEEEVDDTPEPPPVATPPARPAVQASFNKADGTEVEPDRNEADEFAEADDLLDDFFDDDDIPAPGVTEPATDDELFDLNEASMDVDGEDETSVDLSEDAEDVESPDPEESGLVIELDDEDIEDGESFQEMEDTLDDFFGDDDDDDLLDPVDEKDDDALIDEALDDFFDDEDEDEEEATSELDEEAEQIVSDTSEEELMVADDLEDVTLQDATELESSDKPLESEATESEDELEDIEESTDALEQDSVAQEDHDDDLLVDESAPDDEIYVEVDEPESVDPEPALVISPDDTATEFVVDDSVIAEPLADVDESSCVENLQMLLLSVEWEVDDKLLLRLEEEVDSLKNLLQDNNSASIHLDFLGTVVRYISREQADMISASMACLKLIADSLELLMSNQGDVSQCDVNAVRSFVDWHELVVLDFEKRLDQVPEEVKSEEVLVQPDDASDVPQVPDEMEKMKESILKEVRELIAKEISESKG